MKQESEVQKGPSGSFVGNTPDPSAEDFGETIMQMIHNGEFRDEAGYLHWLGQFKIGPPRASKAFSVDKLKKEGMVGLYWK